MCAAPELLSPISASPNATRRPQLPAGWPLLLVIVLYPLWWAFGLSALIWLIVSVPIAANLLMHRRLQAPRGLGVWLLFLMWVITSMVQLIGGPIVNIFIFGFRLGIYMSATIFLLYVINIPVDDLPSRKIAMALGSFFVMLVGFSYADLLLARVVFRSPVEAMLPATLMHSGYVELLVHPKFAEVQHFLGYPVARPAAPFPYTNWWGANLAALAPFAIASAFLARSRRVKVLFVGALALAVPPTILSLNRGMWISLFLGLAYAGFRFALKRNYGLAIGEVIVTVLVGVGIFLTPARQLLLDRLETPASIKGRSSVVEATVDAVSSSPLIGYGLPGARQKSAANLKVGGTSGFVWLVLYSTGWPGLALFMAWVFAAIWTTLHPVSSVQFWAHISILIVAVHMFFYEILPVELLIFMIALGLAVRRTSSSDGIVPPPVRAMGAPEGH